MQFLHALKLGDDTRLDRAADAWMRGNLSSRDAGYLLAKERERQHLNGSRKYTPAVIGKPSKKEVVLQEVTQQEVETEEDEELLTLLAAISEMQEANRERQALPETHTETLH